MPTRTLRLKLVEGLRELLRIERTLCRLPEDELSRVVDGRSRRTSHPVGAGWVAEFVAQVRHHRGDRRFAHRCGGGAIEIRRPRGDVDHWHRLGVDDGVRLGTAVDRQCLAGLHLVVEVPRIDLIDVHERRVVHFE